MHHNVGVKVGHMLFKCKGRFSIILACCTRSSATIMRMDTRLSYGKGTVPCTRVYNFCWHYHLSTVIPRDPAAKHNTDASSSRTPQMPAEPNASGTKCQRNQTPAQPNAGGTKRQRNEWHYLAKVRSRRVVAHNPHAWTNNDETRQRTDGRQPCYGTRYVVVW